MTRRRPRTLFALALAAPLALAGTAEAATLRLSCAGRGPRNSDSAGTVLCAGSASRGRTIAGVVRNDAGQPVAAKVTIEQRSWTPVPGGTGYHVRTVATRELTAGSDGGFSFASRTATKESFVVSVAADAAVGIAVPARAQADVSRQLATTVTKLGGGSVRITVRGTTVRPLKVYVLDASGYELPGVRPKSADGRGRATFDLGSRRGTFTYFVDAGVYGDLFWYAGRPRFRL